MLLLELNNFNNLREYSEKQHNLQFKKNLFRLTAQSWTWNRNRFENHRFEILQGFVPGFIRCFENDSTSQHKKGCCKSLTQYAFWFSMIFATAPMFDLRHPSRKNPLKKVKCRTLTILKKRKIWNPGSTMTGNETASTKCKTVLPTVLTVI